MATGGRRGGAPSFGIVLFNFNKLFKVRHKNFLSQLWNFHHNTENRHVNGDVVVFPIATQKNVDLHLTFHKVSNDKVIKRNHFGEDKLVNKRQES